MCGCRSGRAGTVTTGGLILGYQVTYPDGTQAEAPFMTAVEAKAEIRRRGGGTMTTLYRKP